MNSFNLMNLTSLKVKNHSASLHLFDSSFPLSYHSAEL